MRHPPRYPELVKERRHDVECPVLCQHFLGGKLLSEPVFCRRRKCKSRRGLDRQCELLRSHQRWPGTETTAVLHQVKHQEPQPPEHPSGDPSLAVKAGQVQQCDGQAESHRTLLQVYPNLPHLAAAQRLGRQAQIGASHQHMLGRTRPRCTHVAGCQKLCRHLGVCKVSVEPLLVRRACEAQLIRGERQACRPVASDRHVIVVRP
mmetsp:Transcript_123616/g.384881  ORF Transcript_123616/g.384881 Transcript_123616/m.384881 type:complete len:205 (+) Transcript_123616:666-1280(+)